MKNAIVSNEDLKSVSYSEDKTVSSSINEVNEKLKESIHKYFSEEGINNESDFT